MNISLFVGLRYTGAKRKTRAVSFLSGVSIAGLAVGISLLILVLSVMNGFDRELKERILSLVPQAVIYHRGKVANWRQLRTELEGMDGIVAASPFVQLEGLVSHRGDTMAVIMYGFDPVAEEGVSLINTLLGEAVLARLVSEDALIVLGKSVAERLNVVIGDKVMMVVAADGAANPRLAYFEVAEIIESKTELDSTLALTSLEHAAALAGHPAYVSGLRLKLSDLFAAPSIMYRTTLALGPRYYSSNWTRTHWNLYQAIKMSKSLVGLLMTLIVGIAAFNVISTLVLVVIDKQGDIAILRTLGSSSRQIMAIFVAQGMVIGVLGTLLGVVFGCLLTYGAQGFVSFIESLFDITFLKSDVYPVTYLPTQIRLVDIVSVVVTALVMSLLATIYPAWKATRVQPAQALRYE